MGACASACASACPPEPEPEPLSPSLRALQRARFDDYMRVRSARPWLVGRAPEQMSAWERGVFDDFGQLLALRARIGALSPPRDDLDWERVMRLIPRLHRVQNRIARAGGLLASEACARARRQVDAEERAARSRPGARCPVP